MWGPFNTSHQHPLIVKYRNPMWTATEVKALIDSVDNSLGRETSPSEIGRPWDSHAVGWLFKAVEEYVREHASTLHLAAGALVPFSATAMRYEGGHCPELRHHKVGEKSGACDYAAAKPTALFRRTPLTTY